MTDDGRDKLASLRQQGARFLGQLAEIIHPHPCPPDHWTHIEDNEIRFLFYTLDGLVHILDERITNLEEMMVWAPTGEIQETSGGKLGVYRSSRDREEDEAGTVTLQVEYEQLRHLINKKGPVTEGDRANIALELTRLLDRFVWTYNELGKLRGWPPVQPRTVSRTYWRDDGPPPSQ